MKNVRLDTDFIVAKRLELGYSQRDMERETGLSINTIASLETGRNHTKLTLAMLERVADALQVPAGRLLVEQHRAPQLSTRPDAHISEDARRLGQLLLAAGKAIPRAAAARVLDLGMRRIHEAVHELRAYTSRPDSLLTMTTTNARVGLLLNDDALTPQEVLGVRHAIMALDGLRRPAARVLSAIAHGEATARSISAVASVRISKASSRRSSSHGPKMGRRG